MNRALIDEFRWFAEASRAPRIRPIRQFAEEVIIVPEGIFEGTRYRADVFAWQGLWLDAIDAGSWRRFVLTACVQGGKTLVGWVIPVLWHLFEWKENFGAGVPTMDQAGTKWKLELKPVIDASPALRDLKPTTGIGAKGGKFEELTFRHGPTLKFLSAGGGDEKRSSITLRGSATTEADRLDVAGEASREAAPIYQIEARSLSFEKQARFYAECTSTVPGGFVSREQEDGTGTRPFAQHVGCGAYVSPEREHLHGWQEASSSIEADKLAVWCCPACGEEINDDERREMASRPVALHRGQSIDNEGAIHGEAPETDTFTLRVNCFWNMFWSTGFIGAEEWDARASKDADNAEKRQRQWYWALPVEPNEFDPMPLEAGDVLGTQVDQLTRGVVPPGTVFLAGAADVRRTQLHFVVVAAVRARDGSIHVHVVDWGVVPVESDKHGTRKGLRLGLRKMRDRIEAGYREAAGEKIWRPGWFPIDGFWHGPVVRAFCKECSQMGLRRYIPSFGRGLSAEKGRGRYQHPQEETPKKPYIGEEFYVAWNDRHAQHQLIVNCDHWKGFVREGFRLSPEEPGAITLFEGTTEDELKLLAQFAREVAAEKAMERIVPERGVVTVYVNDSNRPNHAGDAMYNACMALWLSGARFGEVDPASVAAAVARREATPPPRREGDEEPYFAFAREE